MSDLDDIRRVLVKIERHLGRLADAIAGPEPEQAKPESAVSVEAVPKQLTLEDERTTRRSTGGPIADEQTTVSDPAWMTSNELAEAGRLNGPRLSESSLKRFFKGE
jgi:hypothetical protein